MIPSIEELSKLPVSERTELLKTTLKNSSQEEGSQLLKELDKNPILFLEGNTGELSITQWDSLTSEGKIAYANSHCRRFLNLRIFMPICCKSRVIYDYPYRGKEKGRLVASIDYKGILTITYIQENKESVCMQLDFKKPTEFAQWDHYYRTDKKKYMQMFTQALIDIMDYDVEDNKIFEYFHDEHFVTPSNIENNDQDAILVHDALESIKNNMFYHPGEQNCAEMSFSRKYGKGVSITLRYDGKFEINHYDLCASYIYPVDISNYDEVLKGVKGDIAFYGCKSESPFMSQLLRGFLMMCCARQG